MITEQKLTKAIAEAQRFILVAAEAQAKLNADRFAKYGSVETATARRSSMDLTRILAELRKS